MSVGLTIQKADVDNVLGGYARQILDAIANATKVRVQLQQFPDGALTALGYSAGDIAMIRAICTDMQDAGDLFGGMAAPGAPGIPSTSPAQVVALSNGDGTTRQVTLRNFAANLAQSAGLRS